MPSCTSCLPVSAQEPWGDIQDTDNIDGPGGGNRATEEDKMSDILTSVCSPVSLDYCVDTV